MSDIDEYIRKRSAHDPQFAEEFETAAWFFQVGIMLRQAREAAGMTQTEVADQLGTQKSAISRMENHAEDVRLSTLRKYACAVGAELYFHLGS